MILISQATIDLVHGRASLLMTNANGVWNSVLYRIPSASINSWLNQLTPD
jgi:hypothetical protein